MEINSLFGLPAHPLIVHAAVVLLPIAAIGMIVVACIPKSRRYYAPVVFAAALMATVAVGLAQQSGESLQEHVKQTTQVHDHVEEGNTVLPWAIAVTIISGLLAVEPYVRTRVGWVTSRGAVAVLIGASVIVGLGATWTVIQVGHSGATAVWHDTKTG
jgi:hypothetical protein